MVRTSARALLFLAVLGKCCVSGLKLEVSMADTVAEDNVGVVHQEDADEESDEPPTPELTSDEVIAEGKRESKEAVSADSDRQFSDDPTPFLAHSTLDHADGKDDVTYFTSDDAPGCYRTVTVIDEKGEVVIGGIEGVGGSASCLGNSRVKKFELRGRVEHKGDYEKVFVDLSIAGGAIDAQGNLELGGDSPEVHWADGKVWKHADDISQHLEDPYAEECPRLLIVKYGKVTIRGVTLKNRTNCEGITHQEFYNMHLLGDVWTVQGSIYGNLMTFDFSKVDGRKDVQGLLNRDGSIDWADGPDWTVSAGPGIELTDAEAESQMFM